MKDIINEKVLPIIMKFINSKPIMALKDGLLFSMPLLITGSIFLLLANFPITAVVDFFDSMSVTPLLNAAYESTFNIMSIVASIGIAYKYTENEGYAPLPAGVISLAAFLLLQPGSIENAAGESVNVILKTWAAGQGMVCAIIVGLLVGYVYSFFLRKDITIKMPKGVPTGVVNSFNALIPAIVIILVTTIICGICQIVFKTSFIEMIYTMIQTPLQGLTDSLGGVILVAFFIPFLWFFGVHGATIVTGILTGLWTANSAANQAIIDAGKELTMANGGHIVTQQFIDQFNAITGSGITIGIVVYCLWRAKSKQYSELGKISIVPSLFNINEPILFGTPVVLNPILAIPFMVVPVISLIIQYFAIWSGLCPMYTGVMAPWTTPPIISGFIVGDWRTALLQAIILLISVIVYFPFIKRIDDMAYQNEQLAQKENQS